MSDFDHLLSREKLLEMELATVRAELTLCSQMFSDVENIGFSLEGRFIEAERALRKIADTPAWQFASVCVKIARTYFDSTKSIPE